MIRWRMTVSATTRLSITIRYVASYLSDTDILLLYCSFTCQDADRECGTLVALGTARSQLLVSRTPAPSPSACTSEALLLLEPLHHHITIAIHSLAYQTRRNINRLLEDSPQKSSGTTRSPGCFPGSPDCYHLAQKCFQLLLATPVSMAEAQMGLADCM